jgi:hypothetical protein
MSYAWAVRQHSTLGQLLMGAAMVAVECTLLTACGSDNTTNTFSVDGAVANTMVQVFENGKCKFPDASYEPGQSIVLRGADNTILATDRLKVGPDQKVGGMGVCELTFHFDKVKAGQAGYQVTVGSGGPIVVTEHQLRDKVFAIRPRNTLGLMSDDPTITVHPNS